MGPTCQWDIGFMRPSHDILSCECNIDKAYHMYLHVRSTCQWDIGFLRPSYEILSRECNIDIVYHMYLCVRPTY